MGKLLKFVRPERSTSVSSDINDLENEAQIVIFPGVRIERRAAEIARLTQNCESRVYKAKTKETVPRQ